MGDAIGFLAGLKSFSWRPEYATAFTFLAFFVIPLLAIDLANEYRWEEYVFERLPVTRRIGVATAAFLGLACFAANNVNAFIYFQF